MKVRKILHIDDERYEVNGITEALSAEDYEVKVFAWPDDAEDPEQEGKFTELPPFEQYDLILLDVIMGPGDLPRAKTDEGFTTGLVFHETHLTKTNPNLPVFFISALPEGAYKTKARKYAERLGIPYIQKAGDTVSEVLRYIKIYENEGNLGTEKNHE